MDTYEMTLNELREDVMVFVLYDQLRVSLPEANLSPMSQKCESIKQSVHLSFQNIGQPLIEFSQKMLTIFWVNF